MAQLANHSKLEQVSFCVRDFKHPRYYRQKKYRLAALSVLLKKNKWVEKETHKIGNNSSLSNQSDRCCISTRKCRLAWTNVRIVLRLSWKEKRWARPAFPFYLFIFFFEYRKRRKKSMNWWRSTASGWLYWVALCPASLSSIMKMSWPIPTSTIEKSGTHHPTLPSPNPHPHTHLYYIVVAWIQRLSQDWLICTIAICNRNSWISQHSHICKKSTYPTISWPISPRFNYWYPPQHSGIQDFPPPHKEILRNLKFMFANK